MKVLAAGVVIDGAIYSVDKVYTYLISEDLKGAVLPGKRVTVPFGRGNRKKQGLVVEFTEREDTAGLKSIESVIDEKPLLTEELLGIVKHLKNTTFCTWFDAVRTVLPYGICVKIV